MDQRLETLALCHDINISLQKKFRRHRPCANEWHFPLCKEGFVRSYQGFLAKNTAYLGAACGYVHVFSRLKNCSYKLLVSQKCTDKPEGFGSKKYLYSGSDEVVCLIL